MPSALRTIQKLSTKPEGRARKVIMRVEALDNCQFEVVVLFASLKTKFDTNAKLFQPRTNAILRSSSYALIGGSEP
jgi:SRSO17 transposase